MNEKIDAKNNAKNNVKIDVKLDDKNDKHIHHASDVVNLVEKKLDFFQDVIQKTIIHVQKNKMLDILGTNDVNTCINTLNTLSDKIKKLVENMNIITTDLVINNLQTINNELSSLLKVYGTESLEDLLLICFGNSSSIITNEEELAKFNLLKKYFHPTSYKIATLKKTDNETADMKQKLTTFIDDFVSDKMKNMDCNDISLHSKQFHMKVYGVKIYISGGNLKTNLIIYGIVDDIIISFLNNKYINVKKKMIKENMPKNNEMNIELNVQMNNEVFDKYCDSLTLKDYLINTHNEIYNKFNGYLAQHKILKQKILSQVVKDFITSDLFLKRNMLIQLLINSDNYDNKYMAYLLYDILSNDVNGVIDTQEQIILFDSFPWTIKQCFREAMKKTIQYTNDLSNFDINKIPLEQQICLLKASDSVKEKAMIKLKEVKAKSEDSGSKARQYLDGLLKIPFSSYIKEPVMNLMDENRVHFNELKKMVDADTLIIPEKSRYTSIEIAKHMNQIKNQFDNNKTTNQPTNQTTDQPTNQSNIYDETYMKSIKTYLTKTDKNGLLANIMKINNIVTTLKINELHKMSHSGKSKAALQTSISEFIDTCNAKYKQVIPLLNKLCLHTNIISKPTEQVIVSNTNTNTNSIIPVDKHITEKTEKIKQIENNFNEITTYIHNVKSTLDDAVYGHDKAKKQIERIIGQWINGEQDGYCFGFEGPPGVGKTSLAKRGLSNCLKDEHGNSRPFAMIAMGGDSNGSTLHGHNYTYVGSTWGSIVQILIDKKCMNPIIFIDELDKISKTEHGREIVGILTHLLDPTQNDSFQDKYFSGIDLDLSKALFILSYNDVESIDKILLDRIHRIKFSNLSLEDKLVISKSHMLPEVYKKMGLSDMIHMSDEVIKFIIEDYTSEAGVRKLKEILFEIVGEINIDILKNKNYDYEYPINITIADIKTKYFKDKHEIKNKKVPTESSVGIINGLWANAMGKGGVIPIQVKFFPCDKFLDLKLTGMQGDVMKESMNVSLTLAWSLTNSNVQSEIREKYNKDQKYGIHIHCPEGAVPKDGPSAGGAITSVLYSLLNNKLINHHFAMTGEISLDGNITEIGGLDLKFLGGIKAGVTSFIYPEENKKDYETFIEKYKGTDLLKNIIFNSVKNIDQVFELIFE